eukprot:2068087-Alexandrium_andersonii.AAC.1
MLLPHRWGGYCPPPPKKGLRCARRHVSSPPSRSARKTAQNAPVGSFGDQLRVIPGSAQFMVRTREAILHVLASRALQ